MKTLTPGLMKSLNLLKVLAFFVVVVKHKHLLSKRVDRLKPNLKL